MSRLSRRSVLASPAKKAPGLGFGRPSMRVPVAFERSLGGGRCRQRELDVHVSRTEGPREEQDTRMVPSQDLLQPRINFSATRVSPPSHPCSSFVRSTSVSSGSLVQSSPPCSPPFRAFLSPPCAYSL